MYATFAGRKAAALWARAEATKRGFGPDTTKTVQIVMDGAKGLKQNLEPQFPKAIFTLDVCHVVERLWALGRHFHKEGSEELQAWVEELKDAGVCRPGEEVGQAVEEVAGAGAEAWPGHQRPTQGVDELIGYLKPRLDMMRYGEWMEQDLVIASGQVEGAVRHLVGERFDCAGMRWVQEKAEALLHLRCIELNGDWEKFVNWFQGNQNDLKKGERRKVLTDQPLTLAKAA